ncbi:MAG: PAS domain S-box protein [bacterium]|nr:PAS domain S-box protein [bacterium]
MQGEKGQRAIAMLDAQRRPFLAMKKAERGLIETGNPEGAFADFSNAAESAHSLLHRYRQLARYNPELHKDVNLLHEAYHNWTVAEDELFKYYQDIFTHDKAQIDRETLLGRLSNAASGFSKTMQQLGDGEAPIHKDIGAGRRATHKLRALLGLFFVYLFGLGMLRQRGEKHVLQAMVQERTAELAKTVEELESEITERMRAEAKVLQLSSAVEQSPSTVMITDTDGNIEYVNPKFVELTGYTSEEVIGKNPSILKSGHTPPEEYKRLWETITSGGEWRGEFHNKKKEGELFWEAASISPLRDAEGTITHFIAVKKDITEQKRAEELLKESVRQTKLILNSAGEGIYGLDLEGRTTFCNPAAARMIGWEIRELIGKPQHDILHHSKPDGAHYPKEECPIYAAFKDGSVHHVTDEVFWRKDGTSFPVEYVSTPIRDERGELTGAVVVFRDITERKEAEEAVRKTKAFYENLIGQAGAAVVVVDREGTILEWNQVAEQMYGWTAQEVLGRSYLKLNTTEAAEEIKENLKRAFAGEAFGSIEGRRRRKDGTWFDALITASLVRNEEGEAIAAMGVIIDITERKQAGEALERFARQQVALADLGRLALEGGELQGLMDEATRLAAEALGVEMCKILELEESGESLRLVSGVGWREGLVGEASVGAQLDSQAGYTLKNERPVIVEDLRSESRFGGPSLLHDHGVVSGLSVPMVATDLFVFGVMGVHTTQRRDFSKDDVRFLESVANVVTTAVLRKRVEEALREAHEELQQAYDTLEHAQKTAITAEKLAAVGRLTAGVSHEILNPLNFITLCVEMLLDAPDINPERAEHLRDIEEHADRIVKITKGLLSFSRQHPPERRPIELNEVVTKTLALLEYDLKLQNIDVEMNLAEDLPLILADEDQLQQVILNLLTNARDVMPKGGRLVLSTAEVERLFADRERAVELRVEDTGPGIAAEHMDKLFEPFFTTKDVGEGTGLGLSVCQGIIEAHGGLIWAENVSEGGAAFIVHLNEGREDAKQNIGS